MFSPFLDLKSMSEDELLKKINQLSQRMSFAHGMVGDRSMIESLSHLLEAYQTEYQERLLIRAHDQWTSQFPSVIESDPDFKEEKAKPVGTPGKDLRPNFNKKFVRPDLDIVPVPTRHADKDQEDKK